VAAWKKRAHEAEAQVQRLRDELEAVSHAPQEDGTASGRASDELRRLRAENALLTSRAAEARQRLSALLSRLAVLEARR
jgi:predicted aminopeptidase